MNKGAGMVPEYLTCHIPVTRPKQGNMVKWQKEVQREWKVSLRYARMSRIDKNLFSNKYITLTDDMTCRDASLLIQLWTGHIPLNEHLHQIKRTPSPLCP